MDGDSELVRRLANRKPTRVNQLAKGRTALAYAVEGRRYEIAMILLLAGAKPDIPSTVTGLAPIHTAAINGDLKLVRMLVKHGANPQLRGNTPNEIWTPIWAASKNGH